MPINFRRLVLCHSSSTKVAKLAQKYGVQGKINSLTRNIEVESGYFEYPSLKAYYYDSGTTTDQTIIQTKETLRKNKHIKKGDFVINLASTPASEKGMTNMVKLSKVEI